MTTSGVTAWSLTARDMVKASLLELGVISSGEDPEASEMEDCLVRFNGMLKSWQNTTNLFRETTANIVTTPATASVTLSAGIRDVSSVRFVQSATIDRLLYPMGRTDYLSMPNKTTAGSPTMYYLSRQRDAAVLYLWPVSATAATLRIDYSRIAETITDQSETVDVPEEWQETVILGLAERCIGMFGTSRLDPATAANVRQRAGALYSQMLDSDRPDSYRFTYEGAEY
jgi:hypothetical protein